MSQSRGTFLGNSLQSELKKLARESVFSEITVNCDSSSARLIRPVACGVYRTNIHVGYDLDESRYR